MSLQRTHNNNITMVKKIKNLEQSLQVLTDDRHQHFEAKIVIMREMNRLKRLVDHNNLTLSAYDFKQVPYE